MNHAYSHYPAILAAKKDNLYVDYYDGYDEYGNPKIKSIEYDTKDGVHVRREYDQTDSSLCSLERFLNGVLHGKRFLYDDQTVTCETYNEGVLHGETTIKTLDNRLVKIDQFKNGKRHGISTNWDDSGELDGEETYIEGKRHGVCRYFDGDGTLNEEAHFLFDKREGETKEWQEDENNEYFLDRWDYFIDDQVVAHLTEKIVSIWLKYKRCLLRRAHRKMRTKTVSAIHKIIPVITSSPLAYQIATYIR